MRYVKDVECAASFQTVVIQELHELGIHVDLSSKSDQPPPKLRKSRSREDSLNVSYNAVFGNSLELVPAVEIAGFGFVPRFLVHAVSILQRCLDVEGLFRKAGSLARQKELRVRVEAGESLLTDDNSSGGAHDISALVKQFFRELQDPLLTFSLHDTFTACHALSPSSQPPAIGCQNDTGVRATLLVCHLLPPAHLATLRYFLSFLRAVASRADSNKMDASNLAVCLAPNLLYSGAAEPPDAKLLQSETGIVQLLIVKADEIGVVPEMLYQQTSLQASCFPLISNREVAGNDLDIDLDISEVLGGPGGENTASKSKKKKKRSGSLQGIVTNLSSSFTRWRHKDRGVGPSGGAHNTSAISDRSTTSYLSFDRTSLDDIELMTRGAGGGVPSGGYETGMMFSGGVGGCMVYATPKLMRKRKAEDEAMAMPFSTSKKQAILLSMPQRSALGGGQTPFTPATKKGAVLEIDQTPHIQFANGVVATDMVFTAASTGTTTTTPTINTPKCQMSNILSSSSSTAKLNRKVSSGKSGCFSPKATSKRSSIRQSFRGFLRRLSGSKESVASSASTSRMSDMSGLSQRSTLSGATLASSSRDDYDAVSHASASNHVGGVSLFFRRGRKKTPSSPACLVTDLNPAAEGTTSSRLMRDVCGSSEALSRRIGPLCQPHMDIPSNYNQPFLHALTNPNASLEILTNQNVSLEALPSLPHGPFQRRRFASADDGISLGGPASLRRGRPNTVASGLPSPVGRRSIDVSSVEEGWDTEAVGGAGEGGVIGKSDVSGGTGRRGTIGQRGVLDTSPILRLTETRHTDDVGEKDTEDAVDDYHRTNANVTVTRGRTSRHRETCSHRESRVADQTLIDGGVAGSGAADESEHDRAFTESMLCDNEEDEEDVMDRGEEDGMDVAVENHNGMVRSDNDDNVLRSVHAPLHDISNCSRTAATRIGTDGAVGTEGLVRCTSKQSMRSMDSGLGPELQRHSDVLDARKREGIRDSSPPEFVRGKLKGQDDVKRVAPACRHNASTAAMLSIGVVDNVKTVSHNAATFSIHGVQFNTPQKSGSCIAVENMTGSITTSIIGAGQPLRASLIRPHPSLDEEASGKGETSDSKAISIPLLALSANTGIAVDGPTIQILGSEKTVDMCNTLAMSLEHPSHENLQTCESHMIRETHQTREIHQTHESIRGIAAAGREQSICTPGLPPNAAAASKRTPIIPISNNLFRVSFNTKSSVRPTYDRPSVAGETSFCPTMIVDPKSIEERAVDVQPQELEKTSDVNVMATPTIKPAMIISRRVPAVSSVRFTDGGARRSFRDPVLPTTSLLRSSRRFAGVLPPGAGTIPTFYSPSSAQRTLKRLQRDSPRPSPTGSARKSPCHRKSPRSPHHSLKSPHLAGKPPLSPVVVSIGGKSPGKRRLNTPPGGSVQGGRGGGSRVVERLVSAPTFNLDI